MSSKAETVETVEAVKPSGKSKKLLIIILGAVVTLALAGGAAWYFLIAKQADVEDPDGEPVVAQKGVKKGPPAFLPLDSMVLNLADPGVEKVIQVGITLELSDAKAAELVKQYLPKIRSTILLKLSEQTSQEVLPREGKDKLAADILEEVQSIFPDVDAAGSAKDKKKEALPEKPIVKILFTNFIVQ